MGGFSGMLFGLAKEQLNPKKLNEITNFFFSIFVEFMLVLKLHKPISLI